MFRTLLFMSLLAAGTASAQTAPYVNAAVADSEFAAITAQDMDRIRGLKILFGSRSFGYNLRSGLTSLEASDAMYEIINDDYVNYDVMNNGGNVDIVDADAFDRYNFVHFMCTASPWTKRNYEFDELMRDWPHNFVDDINIAMLYYHGGDMSAFSVYSAVFDSLRSQYPHITFIYVTGGFEAETQVAHNTSAAAFSAAVRARYQGIVPLYDLGRILNDDDRCGDHYCAEYSTDPAGVHPNVDFIQRRMGKGFLVMLNKIFHEGTDSCTDLLNVAPQNVQGTGVTLHGIRLTWDPVSGCYDRYAVRRDGAVVGTSFGPGFNDVGLEENTGYAYSVAVVDANGDTTVFSTPVTVYTGNDSVAPGISEIPTTLSATGVTIRFNEDVDSASAVTTGNYTIDGGVTVLGAELTETYEVFLTTTTLTENIDYTLTVTGVTDQSVNANTMSGVQGTFRYSLVTVANDYAGYWAFENSLADSSANNTAAAWTGTPAYSDLGVKGACLTFDGTDSCGYVQINDNGVMDGQEDFAICLWAKKDAAATGGRLLHKHVSYYLNITDEGLGGYFFNIGGVRLNFGATVPGINDAEWHHYALTHDGDTARVFVDAVPVFAAALEGSLENSTRTTYVGRDPWGRSFAGDIDEIRVYHWALDAAELNELVTGAAANRDSLAVRALLDANGDTRSVDGAATFNSDGRITELLLQADVGGSISSITSHIGQLTELEVLHAYGPQNHDHASAYLTDVDPAIGNCAKLKTLLLNDNDLASLPAAITALESLTVLSVGNNLLCGVDEPVQSWLDTYDPDWDSTQVCAVDTGDTSGIAMHDGPDAVPFTVRQGDGMLHIAFGAGVTGAGAVVYDMNGAAAVTVQELRNGVLECPLASLGHGMHVVKLTADGVTYWQKIVVVQ